MAAALNPMTLWLSLVSLLLALLAHLALRDRKQRTWTFDGARSLTLLALVVIAALVASLYGPAVDRTGLLAGLFPGALASWLVSVVGGAVAPLALGVAGASALHILSPTQVPAGQFALLVGLGLGAIAMGVDGALMSALTAVLCVVGDRLGEGSSQVVGAAYLGSEVGLAVAIGAMAVAWDPKRLPAIRPVVVGILAFVAAYFACRPLGEPGLALAAGLGAVSGVVLHWLLPEGDADAVRIGLAAIIGIGVATIAFGLGRGAGMALALSCAGGVLLAVGNVRALLTLGPLVGLVMYRVLREQGTGASRALDIGQHYTLLALILGAVVPLLPTDWLRREGIARSVGAVLWGLLYLALPPLVIVMFGLRGAIGFIVGLGLTGLIQAARQQGSLMPLAIGTGLSSSTILCSAWLSKTDELARDDKVRLFAYAGVGILIVAAGLAFLSRPNKNEVTA